MHVQEVGRLGARILARRSERHHRGCREAERCPRDGDRFARVRVAGIAALAAEGETMVNRSITSTAGSSGGRQARALRRDGRGASAADIAAAGNSVKFADQKPLLWQRAAPRRRESRAQPRAKGKMGSRTAISSAAVFRRGHVVDPVPNALIERLSNPQARSTACRPRGRRNAGRRRTVRRMRLRRAGRGLQASIKFNDLMLESDEIRAGNLHRGWCRILENCSTGRGRLQFAQLHPGQ